MEWLSLIAPFCGRGMALMLVLIVVMQPTLGMAAEITPFRLTGYSAFLTSDTLFTTDKFTSLSGETDTSSLYIRRELGANTRGYIYHPNLLDMRITGGIYQDSSSLTSDDSETSRSRFSWNLSAHFDVLKEKPYPLSLFFTQNNAVVPTGTSEVYIQTNRNYGFNLRLRDPFIPVPMVFSVNRSTTQGESDTQIIDNANNQLRFSTSARFFGVNMAFDYSLNHALSASGIVNRPVREFEYVEHLAALDSTASFGKKDQFGFYNRLEFFTRDNPGYNRIRFAPRLTWKHSSALDSVYNYTFNRTSRLDSSADDLRHFGSATMMYTYSENLNATVGANAGHAKQGAGAQQQDYGIDTTVRYWRPIPYGRIRLSGKLSYDIDHREAAVSEIQVLDEEHTVVGFTPVALVREFIFIPTVVVRDRNNPNIKYEPDTDYRLFVIGAQTFIERLIGGSMADPQQPVLVDYKFDPGGNYDFSILAWSANISMNLFRYFELFANYFENDFTLTSGLPTLPLNSARTIETGARTATPFPLPWWQMKVGGDARYNRRDEEINSSESYNINGFLSLPLPYRSDLRLSVGRAVTVNKNSPFGGDSISYSANLNSRPWRNISLGAGVRYDVDSGGFEEVIRNSSNLRAAFTYRKVNITASASYYQQVQGTSERDALTALLTVRRDIW